MFPNIWSSSGNRTRRNYPILSLFDEVNRVFDEAGSLVPAGNALAAESKGYFIPLFDVKETSKDYVLTGELAGLTKEDVNIELKDNTLKISGEKRSETERKEGEKVYTERSYGSFLRTFPFDTEIDEDNAVAEMKEGVLTITIPKSARVVKGAKKLSIK